MSAVVRSLCVLAVAAVWLIIPTAASARPASTTFTIAGYEYAFTQTVGSFAGTGTGNAGERTVWNARVVHDELGSNPTYVNGGSFQMATRSPSGPVDFVTGRFAFHGGTITTVDPGANCTNQRFLVTGMLSNVSTTTTAGGTGTFRATLTHFRTRIFGRCIIYAARVAGAVGFTY